MDLFTLNENFLAEDPVDEFISVIWTERYSTAGEVQLVVPATEDLTNRLREGRFLGLRGSKEVMILDTQSIEKNLMTVTGKTLVGFLNEREAWFHNSAYPGTADAPRIADRTDVEVKPGQFIADVVKKMVIAPDTYEGGNLDWAQEVIPGLVLGPVDASGDTVRLTAPVGPLYDAISPIAEQYGVGISLYLDSASAISGYVLKFTTYKGKDRTSSQTVNPLVRLVPALDSLSDVKEVRSISGYKNVVYVWYAGELSIHYADPDAPVPEGFARRVLVTDAEGAPPGHKVTYTGPNGSGGTRTFTYTEVSPEDIAAFRAQNARDALANHNYIRAVDGQTSNDNEYQFGTDYFMGDIIELEGLTGVRSRARVTEYIRAQDTTGEKSYPTITVIT